jgi:sec-independent protein translocase protein TatA
VEGIFSPTHLLILGFIALLVFGPKRLPELGRALGSSMREFRHGASEISEQFSDEGGSSAARNAQAERYPAAAEESLVPPKAAEVPALAPAQPPPAVQMASVQAPTQGSPAAAEETDSAAANQD